METLYTVGVVLPSLLLIGGIVLWINSMAEKDRNFLNLAVESGKIVVMGKTPVNIVFNSPDGYYRKNGEWVKGGRQWLGWWFKLTRRAFFGIYPIWKVFKFSITWAEYAEGVMVGEKRSPPTITEKKLTDCDSFNRFYTHTVKVDGAEMGPEDSGDDSATTRIDAVLLITFVVKNILKAVYKIPPEGIEFDQTDASLEAAFNDYVKDRKWSIFKGESKGAPDSDFVLHMIEAANRVLDALDIGLGVEVIELKYHDLSVSPENEKLAASRVLVQIAENEGAAAIALAERKKTAAKLEGEGEAAKLLAVKEVLGEGIGEYANLGQVANTELRVYGKTDVAVPVVGTDGDKKERGKK